MMKISLSRFAAPLLIAPFLALSIPCHAQDDQPKSPLAQQMGGIAKDFRALRKIVADPAQKDAALQLVKDMEDHATKAKAFEPAKTKDIAPADKDQFVADFRKQIDGLIGDMQKLEVAIASGDSAGASALLDKLQGDKRAGHKKFIAQDEGAPGGHQPPPPPASPSPAQ